MSRTSWIARQGWLLLGLAVFGCDDGADTNAENDCRQAAFTCGDGFKCLEGSPDVWRCLPADGPSDGSTSGDDAGEDMVDAERATPDAMAPEADAAPLTPDVGLDEDAGPEPDAESNPDAGQDADAEVDPDAGPNLDAEVDPDAGCLEVPEVCDGVDQNCNGEIDEEAPCGPGRACQAGVCEVVGNPPGSACADDADCAGGRCDTEETVPGGFCVVACEQAADCGPNGACVRGVDGGVCVVRCEQNSDCREEWVCSAAGACVADCVIVGCPAPLVCNAGDRVCQVDACAPAPEMCNGVDDDCDGTIDEGDLCPDNGLCEGGRCVAPAIPFMDVSLESIVLLPTKIDGRPWDGFGEPNQNVLDLVDAAFEGDDTFASIVEILNGGILDLLAQPDPYGTVRFLIEGEARGSFDLVEQQDTLRPEWPVEWLEVPVNRNLDLRMEFDLTDADFGFDDTIGVVTVGTADMLMALADGQPFPVAVNNQGTGQMLFVVIQVIPTR